MGKLIILFAVGLVGGAALAQKSYSYQPGSGKLDVGELRQERDGGVRATVYAIARSTEDGGPPISKQRDCAPSDLSAAQRTACRTCVGALEACWNAGEGL